MADHWVPYMDFLLVSRYICVYPSYILLTFYKDSFNIKGVPSTLGYILFDGSPVPEENSPVIDILLSLGAVIHVKTNVPQTLMVRGGSSHLIPH
jgi:amidase